MKLGIIGLPQSGKNTIFEALTHHFSKEKNYSKNRISIVPVKDQRITNLSNLYNPKKTIHAQIEYFLPKSEKNILNQVRDCDALVEVIRNFNLPAKMKSSPIKDFNSINQELILSDTLIIENRLERLNIEKKKGKKINPEEENILKQCLSELEKEKPLREVPDIKKSKIIKGFSFLSIKPKLVLINNDYENNFSPSYFDSKNRNLMIIKGKLEQELAQFNEKDSADFLKEFGISEPAINQVINKSYSLLGLISFFTVGKDEVKAWTIKANTTALNAAEVIHSDIKKGFIRAELVSYENLIKSGSYSEAKKKGLTKLEGKTYIIRDGDIINFRFNV